MLEGLAATTGVELGKLVLEQVLNLSKPVLEKYVQDFFKDCLSSGVARLNAATLKAPMAEAIGYFIKRFIKELQLNDIPATSIQHHYQAAIKTFVQDKAVRPILGKAFEKDCKQIDYGQLEQIWTQQYQVSGWQFPSEEFDWRSVCKEYVYEVKSIVKANAELRSLLTTELMEDIARNTAQLSPGFDVAAYRASLQSSYGYLKLYILDSTDRVDAIKLWNMFIEQTVREALPPTRYDLPLDLKRQLQAAGQLETDLSLEALEHYRHEYFQQPARKVLAAIADSQRAVILGDPGSGKSSLLQYLALAWVESQTSEVSRLPLLIELREFALTPTASFLEFLHRGRGVDWQFDQQQLHQHLLESPTLVMFDGLDEVFDRATQSTVIDDIIRFSQQYPKAQILITSRIIGYNPDRLQHSSFQHFTIQSLDTDEIHEFIDRWYDLSMGSDPDKVRLKQRLKDAIANSNAIANLADNPLLLTMMAILNRRQELPRDRSDLYDQASRVLLYHWDVDHKRLQIPMDAIGRREKQEMLRLIAYEMQAGEEGLKGNLISAENLTRILTNYLRDQGFSEPREKANRLIQQLRDRNFILCYRGADTYGFMHRTFLEYFCAVEIVHRFEKQRSLTFKQLRDEIFGQHWQDETWHEVLRLICGAIDPKQAKELIGHLINLRADDIEENTFSEQKIRNILLAIGCFTEIRNHTALTQTSEQLLESVKVLVEDESIQRWYWEAIDELAGVTAKAWGENIIVLQWLQSCLETQGRMAPYFAMSAIIQGWSNSLDILSVLKIYAQGSESLPANRAAIQELIKSWKDEPDTLLILRELARKEGDGSAARQLALHELVENCRDDPETLIILETLVHNKSEYGATRAVALDELVKGWTDKPTILPTLKVLAQQDESPFVRSSAIRNLAEFWKGDSELATLLRWIIENDPFEHEGRWLRNPRRTALEAFFKNYPMEPETIDLLHDRALNDPDEQLREWAQEQLKKIEKDK